MPTSVLVLFFLPLAVAAAIAITGKPPRESLKILAVVIPFQAFGALEAGFTITPGYLVLFVILVGILARGEFLTSASPEGKPLIFFLGIATLATLVAICEPRLPQLNLSTSMQYRAGPWRSPIQLVLLFFHFSLFFIVINFIKDQRSADSLLKIHLGTAVVLSCLGIYQVIAFTFGLPLGDCTWSVNLVDQSATINYSSIRFYSARIAEFSTRATFAESRGFAEYLLSAVPISTAFCVSGSPDIRRRFGILASPFTVIIGLTGIFLTMSRSGWVCLAVAFLIIAIRLSRRFLFIYIPVLLALLSGVSLLLAKAGFFAATATSLWDIISGRFEMYYVLHDPRVNVFLALWESFKSHPILGLGAGNFALWGAAHNGLTTLFSAHGFMWAVLADFGLVGFAALSVVFAAVFRKLNRAIRLSIRHSAERTVMVGIFAALLATLINSMFGGDRPQFYLVFIMGMAMAYATMTMRRAPAVAKR